MAFIFVSTVGKMISIKLLFQKLGQILIYLDFFQILLKQVTNNFQWYI